MNGDIRELLAARRDALPGLSDDVLEVLAREVTVDDCYRAAESGGYDVATLVALAGRIVARELLADDELEQPVRSVRTIATPDVDAPVDLLGALQRSLEVRREVGVDRSADAGALEQLSRAPHRCPRCLVRYPLPGYECRGGWQTYPDPDGPRSRPHPPTLVERIPQ